MKIDYLSNIFHPYLYATGMTHKEAAKILGMSQKTFGKHLAMGVSTWPVNDVLKLGKALGIPIDTIRKAMGYEQIHT
jgi:predicted DNA-binding protein (UPF0251 family)